MLICWARMASIRVLASNVTFASSQPAIEINSMSMSMSITSFVAPNVHSPQSKKKNIGRIWRRFMMSLRKIWRMSKGSEFQKSTHRERWDKNCNLCRSENCHKDQMKTRHTVIKNYDFGNRAFEQWNMLVAKALKIRCFHEHEVKFFPSKEDHWRDQANAIASEYFLLSCSLVPMVKVIATVFRTSQSSV